MKNYLSIGVMSGTSMDGLDIVACKFSYDKGWSFEIIKSITLTYSHKWITKLTTANELNALEFLLLHNEFGRYIGKKVKTFCSDLNEKPELICSHGHTIFHQPGQKLTFQIGSGAEIAAISGISTVCDFRSLDVALGGQGAPLVPIGDELLFGEYDICLNIGGIANISFRVENERKAFDVCPANMAFNHFCRTLGFEYDLSGNLGRTGSVNTELLELLNSLEYYEIKGPKSLGREWFDTVFLPIIYSFQMEPNDILRTLYEHITDQIVIATDSFEKGTIFITGGGAHNYFLIELLSEKIKHKTIVPSEEIIDFKEAIIFAFIGVMRNLNQINSIKSVTGTAKDHSGGVIYLS